MSYLVWRPSTTTSFWKKCGLTPGDIFFKVRLGQLVPRIDFACTSHRRHLYPTSATHVLHIGAAGGELKNSPYFASSSRQACAPSIYRLCRTGASCSLASMLAECFSSPTFDMLQFRGGGGGLCVELGNISSQSYTATASLMVQMARSRPQLEKSLIRHLRRRCGNMSSSHPPLARQGGSVLWSGFLPSRTCTAHHFHLRVVSPSRVFRTGTTCTPHRVSSREAQRQPSSRDLF